MTYLDVNWLIRGCSNTSCPVMTWLPLLPDITKHAHLRYLQAQNSNPRIYSTLHNSLRKYYIKIVIQTTVSWWCLLRHSFVSWLILRTTSMFAAGISSVGIATRYELDSPGIEFRWGARFSAPFPDLPWGPSSLLYNEYRVFPRGKTAGAWCWPPTPIFSAEVLKRVGLFLYLP